MSDTADAANVVRFPRKLIPFPPQRPNAESPSDRVMVMHAGEMRVYESPEALAAAFRVLDPVAMRRLSEMQGRIAKARALEGEARHLLYLARADRRRASRRHQLAGFLAGIMFTLIVGAMLAGTAA